MDGEVDKNGKLWGIFWKWSKNVKDVKVNEVSCVEVGQLGQQHGNEESWRKNIKN